MAELTDSILQIGLFPAITGYLLYDYSKKLTAINQEITKITEIMRTNLELNKKIEDHLEKCRK